VNPCSPNPCNNAPGGCFLPLGICKPAGASFTCDYQFKQAGIACDDGDPCTNSGIPDVCDGNGTCSGDAKICQTPPAAACLDGVVTSFLISGQCDGTNGACDYPSFEDTCAFGACDPITGLCAGNPCNNKEECVTPPSSCYQDTGTCEVISNVGRCSYAPRLPGTPCTNLQGCEGVCTNGGVCIATSCGAGGAAGAGQSGAAGDGGAAGDTSAGGAAGEGGEAGTAGVGGASGSGAAGQSGAGAGGAGTSGQGGASGGGGQGNAGGQPGASTKLPRVASKVPSTEIVESVQEGGCGCRAAGSSSPPGALGAALATLALLRRRPRRPVAQK
jgi:MYXO-CTERM domain-containing protein